MRTSLFKFFWEIKTVLPCTSLQCADSPADQQITKSGKGLCIDFASQNSCG